MSRGRYIMSSIASVTDALAPMLGEEDTVYKNVSIHIWGEHSESRAQHIAGLLAAALQQPAIREASDDGVTSYRIKDDDSDSVIVYAMGEVPE